MILQILGWFFIVWASCLVVSGLYVWGVRRGIRHAIVSLDLTEDQLDILQSKLKDPPSKLIKNVREDGYWKNKPIMQEPQNNMIN